LRFGPENSVVRQFAFFSTIKIIVSEPLLWDKQLFNPTGDLKLILFGRHENACPSGKRV
jgi:hypothetical protein